MTAFNSELFTNRLNSLLNNDSRPKGEFYKTVAASGIVFNWKKRGSAPQADKLLAIAQYFSVSVDYLVGLSDDPTPSNRTTCDPATNKHKTLHVKSPDHPYFTHSHDIQDLFGQVQRICNQRGPRDIDKMKLFLSALDPGEEEE